MSALITLLSDFGSSGPYPAAMKAVIASYCDPLFIDISHEVPRHDIRAGAYLLFTVAPFTPAGTIHLAVVDPGVGTPRRALILTSGGQFFVGPDNGLLVPAARRVGTPRAFAIDDKRLMRGIRSETFHGRDLFAPAAALLANGTRPSVLGSPASELTDLEFGAGRLHRGTLTGEIIYTDPFGNLITNIPASLLPARGTRVMVRTGRKATAATVARTYGEGTGNRLLLVAGSDGFAEIAIREASAARALGARPGSAVRITPRS
jgi:hypothetical protein